MRHIVLLCVFLVASCNQPADFYDTNGKGYAYSEFAGKWQVINYWATWCAPCIKEIPELIALDNRHEDIVVFRSEEHTSELQSRRNLVCRLLLEKKKKKKNHK